MNANFFHFAHSLLLNAATPKQLAPFTLLHHGKQRSNSSIECRGREEGKENGRLQSINAVITTILKDSSLHVSYSSLYGRTERICCLSSSVWISFPSIDFRICLSAFRRTALFSARMESGVFILLLREGNESQYREYAYS